MFKYFKKKKFLSQTRNQKYGSVQLIYTRPEEGEIDKKVLKKDLKIIKKAFKPYTKVKHIFPSILKSWHLSAVDFDVNILSLNTFYPTGWYHDRLLTSKTLYICYLDESKIHALIQPLNLNVLQIVFSPYPTEMVLENVLSECLEFVWDTDPSNGLPQIECPDCEERSNLPDIDGVLDKKLLISCCCCAERLDYPLNPKQHRKLMNSFYDYAIKR
jgi:hypothetical protein